jgi:hypothetical protein
LLVLRSEFGKDLSRLSTSERNKLDSVCSRFQTTRGREGYLDCLQAQLASLPARPSRAIPVAPAEPGATAIPVNASLDAVASTALSSSSSSSFPSRTAIALVVTVAGISASALALFVVKARRARHVCRVCAVRVPGTCDLCPACRHNAAEALRRAATERADRQRAHEDEPRRQREQAEEQRQQKARADEDARLLQEAREREREAREREEAVRQREEDARRQQGEEFQRTQAAVSDDVESAVNPYVVLGLAQNASDEQVRAAFEEARSKYDPELVAHLGADVQEHYASKSRAAARAYGMLTGEVDARAATVSSPELHGAAEVPGTRDAAYLAAPDRPAVRSAI